MWSSEKIAIDVESLEGPTHRPSPGRHALRHTGRRFGTNQAAIYRTTVLAALAELHDGPDIIGAKARDDLSIGLRTLHVARHGRRGRHFVMFRVEPPQTIKILRILYDSMDFARHLPPET